MNIKELIEKYEEVIYHGYVGGVTLSNYKTFLDELIQLEESQKPIIPRFVADWIERCKKEGRSLYGAMYQEEKVGHWLENDDRNMELFIKAWRDGYKIEKEERYLVKIVGMDNINGYLSYNKDLEKWFFGIASESRPYRARHTQKELENDGFGWVFSCKGIEITKVEE